MKKIISIVSLAIFIGALVVPVIAVENGTKIVTTVKEDPTKDKAGKATVAKDENKTATKSETKAADKKDCSKVEKKDCAKKCSEAKKAECTGEKSAEQK